MLMEADLPEDMDALRALALEQSRIIAEERAAAAEMALTMGEAEAEIERLQSIIYAFMRHRFGPRSEQLDPDQLQLALEDVQTALAEVKAASEAKRRTSSDRPRKTNRGSLPTNLERIEQVVDVDDKACPCCGGALHQIGEDVSERLDVVPTTFRVLVTRRPRYGCRSCESAVVQAPAPARIVEGGIPTEALIAQVLVSKYADHLPLYRQAQIYARQGIQLDRSTLAALRQAQEGRPSGMVSAPLARSYSHRAQALTASLRRRDAGPGARSWARPDQDRPALGLCSR
jgi:transposase